MKYHFFDSASTTQCCDAAAQIVQRFAVEEFGNPSSSHALGQHAARAIRESRAFFARTFRVDPEQVIFTGSGSEADNLAVYGIAMEALARRKTAKAESEPPRVLCSATEHPAVRKTVQSLTALGVDAQLIPVDERGQIRRDKFLELLTPNTLLVSVQQVNNITGTVLPVQELARLTKERVPEAVFHTDAVQGFGKAQTITAPSPIDLISISGHKVKGPKGIGALIVLNKPLLKSGLRPLIWGGEQEGGFRSGTQNAGLIAGFQAAAEKTVREASEDTLHILQLRNRFRELLLAKGLVSREGKAALTWNSPEDAVPHIVSLSVPGLPSGPLAKLLEERGFLVSTGSACSSQKMEPDAVLAAMGLPQAACNSALRVSFSTLNSLADVEALAGALDESLALMAKLLGGKSK